MKLKEVREIVEGMELSVEAMVKVTEILDDIGEEAEIPDETIDKILAIVDVEIDANQLAADIYQNGADMTNEFLDKVDKEANKIANELEIKKPL